MIDLRPPPLLTRYRDPSASAEPSTRTIRVAANAAHLLGPRLYQLDRNVATIREPGTHYVGLRLRSPGARGLAENRDTRRKA